MNRDLNILLILKVLGGLLLIEGVFLFSPIVVAFIYGETEMIRYYLLTIGVAVVLGGSGLIAGWKAESSVGKREGAVIVTSTWILYTIVGALPFALSGYIPNVTDAFFETLSGFTTTGTTILNNIESLPYNLLFWRSMTHWIGGLGIVVIFLAVLPMIGGTGYQLFTSESTTPTKEKILPRINDTAKILLFVYVILSVLCMLALRLAGMNFFDAVNHALSTISTGGFSTRKNEELKYYVIVLLVSAIIIFLSHLDYSQSSNFREFEQSFRSSLFIVTSCITSTGLATEDYTLWNSFTWVVMLVLMVSGASTYSTSGGIKISRIVLITKFCYYEFKKLIHPNAIMPVKYNGQVVRDDVMMRILAFSMIYIIIIIVGTFFLSLSGLGFQESFSGMITCMSDVGLGLGQLGPTHSFSEIPVLSKWFLAFVMIVGRLEIYSVLLLFMPDFWKK